MLRVKSRGLRPDRRSAGVERPSCREPGRSRSAIERASGDSLRGRLDGGGWNRFVVGCLRHLAGFLGERELDDVGKAQLVVGVLGTGCGDSRRVGLRRPLKRRGRRLRQEQGAQAEQDASQD